MTEPAQLPRWVGAPEIDDGTRRRITEECLRAAAQLADDEARRRLFDRVVVANLQVAQAIAMRYRGRGVAMEDLEQVAAMALVRAARAFDPDRGHDFLSYAVPTMRGAIMRYFRDQGWAIRPPSRVRELQTRVLEAAAVLEGQHGEATAAAISRCLEEPVTDVAEALAARGCFRPVSLDAPLGGVNVSLGDFQAVTDGGDVERVEARLIVAAALEMLDERAKKILYLRFFEGRTQQEIGEQIGISQMQVSRELRRILRLLRERVADDVDEAG